MQGSPVVRQDSRPGREPTTERRSWGAGGGTAREGQSPPGWVSFPDHESAGGVASRAAVLSRLKSGDLAET